jgi:hypothetical protein
MTTTFIDLGLGDYLNLSHIVKFGVEEQQSDRGRYYRIFAKMISGEKVLMMSAIPEDRVEEAENFIGKLLSMNGIPIISTVPWIDEDNSPIPPDYASLKTYFTISPAGKVRA